MDSLQDICLREIAKNFNVYSAWYGKCKGTTCAKPFEFLRRVYSDTIFSAVLDHLENEHLDLLINPYLRHLDICHVEKRLIQSIANKLKTNGNGIETIKARCSKLLYEQLIPSSSHLVDIEVGGFGFSRVTSIYGSYTSEVIKSLGRHCPVLRVLKLRDEGRYLAGECILSEKIKLHPEFYEAVSYLLDRCPSLEILENINTAEILHRKHETDFQNNDLGKCRKYSLKKLSFLNRKKYPLMDAFEICFHLCPKVTCLELHWMNGNQLVRCPDFKALKDVKILVHQGTTGDMNEFLKISGSKLVNLRLFDACISVQTLIRCCPVLKDLTLGFVEKFGRVEQEDFSLFATGLPKLKSFCVCHNLFSEKWSTNAVKLIISVAKNLETLYFHSSRKFSEEFCNSIFELGLHRLPELSVSHTDIPVSFLIKLLLQGNIQKLNVSSCDYIRSSEDRNNLLRFKQANQTVNVECQENWYAERYYDLCGECEFSDISYSGSDCDSDLDSDFDVHCDLDSD